MIRLQTCFILKKKNHETKHSNAIISFRTQMYFIYMFVINLKLYLKHF